MKKTFKRLLASLMVAVMVLTAAPLSDFVGLKLLDIFNILASAESYSGTCGDNLTWNLDTATGELVISGTGAMEDYCVDGSGDTRPWKEHCDSIKTVVVGVGITTIGDYAFFNCTELRDLILPNGITIIGDYSFNYCRSLVILTLPKSLKKIGDWTFAACTGVESVEIPNSVSSIGTWAFFCCSNLKSITIPDNVTVINDFAFYCCENITDVFYNGSEVDWANINFGTNNECLTNATIHFNSFANNNSYKVGDIIEFGSYPQSEVTDTSLLSVLKSLSLSWASYGYYSGTGDWDDGQMQPSDYMKYADVTYKGERYRAVKFTEYRPYYTGGTTSNATYQDDNGYHANKVYWFKFEPLKWRVLNLAEGFVMCESIIDSQPYNNTVYYSGYYYQDTSKTNYANDYSTSSIRDWLNDDFYHTAFTAEEKSEIQNSVQDNNGFNSKYDSETTNDKMFLLSWDEVTNSEYGFDSDPYVSDTARRAQGTDYAKAQGLHVYNSPSSEYHCNSWWWLRSPGSHSSDACIVEESSDCGSVYEVYYTTKGVRPALKLNLQSVANPETPDDFTESIKLGADRFSFGQDMTGVAGDTFNALLVYTSKENDINDLTITSSNSAIATVGTPNIDTGDYITGENELRATLPITLKSAGTATITVTAPNRTSTSVIVDVYESIEDSQDVQAYINEHISFANSNRYANLTTNASFYNSIWKHEEGSRNFTRYAAWDVIGRVGKFAALDFSGAFQTDNPYDVLLADVFSNYVNNEYGKSAEVFENTAKTILGAPSVATDILGAFNATEEMDSNVIKALKDFINETQNDWVNGVFLTSENFTLNSTNAEVKELYNSLAKAIKGLDENKLGKVFKGLNYTGTIFDYIGTGTDMVFRFFDAYQKYLLAEALYETNEYILSSVEIIARQEMSVENGDLLLDALDPYWSVCNTDSAFEIVNDFVVEHGFIYSGVDTIFKYLGANLAREFIHKWIFSVTGISYNALIATYNLTYLCLDYLSGLGKLDETHTLMNAAALLEKEYLELVKKEANELKNDASLENAAMFDTSWGFLQSLESYCYKTLSTYASAMKKEYTTNYVIKNSAANNLFYTLISTNQLVKDLSVCDSGIQSAVYLESEWVNSNCHKSKYPALNLGTVKCPTDVCVYDNEGNLVLSIVNNKVTLCDSYIVAFVDGDEKIFVLPTDQEYDVKIIATDNGTMQYSVQSYKDLELLRTVIYDDVELAESKSYTGSIPTESDALIDEYNLKSESGVEIKADYDSSVKLQSGTCGDNLTWTFDEYTGTITISGTGAMDNYYDETKDRMLITPWDDFCDKIKTIVIEDGVTSVGDASFAYCKNVTEVTIADSVTRIGIGAFFRCDSLEEVFIPNCVSTIEKCAFEECSNLKRVTISDGVITIGERAFSYTSITDIVLPKSVNSIGRLALLSPYLTNINVDTQNSVYSSDNYGVLFNKNKTILIQYPIGNTREKYVIPKEVKTIGVFAFAFCGKLTSITVPGTVTTIKELAFDWCTGLTSVVLEEGVKNIGYSAFAYCESLEYMHIPKSVTSIERDEIFSIIDDTNAYICSDTVDCYAKEYADEFGIEFRVCDGHGVNTESKNSGICGDNLTWTFYENSGKLVINGTGDMYDGTNKYGHPFYDLPAELCSKIKAVYVEDGVTRIGNYAFRDFENLEAVVVPDNLQSIGQQAFSNTVYFANQNNWKNNALYLNNYLLEVSIKNISDETYEVLDETILIADSAFYALFDSSKFKRVIIPDSVVHIGSHTFNYCSSLEYVEIGKGVKSIGTDFIWGSSYLKRIDVDSDNQYYSSDKYGVLFNKSKSILIKYPADSEREYVIPNTVIEIADQAFGERFGNGKIEKVIVPNSVKIIGNYAFENCSNLLNVELPDGVTYIGRSAFYGCESLQYVHIPESVAVIESSDDWTIVEGTKAYICSDVVNYYAKEYADEFGIEFRVCDGHGIKTEPEVKGKVHSAAIDNISLDYKSSATITPSINADSGVKYTVSYSSSNEAVATVDANGKVTTRDTGTATITVTVKDEYGNTVTDTCNVEVKYTWWQWIIVIVLFGWIWY